MSTSSLLRIEQSELPQLLLETRDPDMARYREAFWASMQRDEYGAIPPNALIQAVRQKAFLQTQIASTRFLIAGIPIRFSSHVPQTAGLNPNHTGWTELGPTAVGGRTRAIAIDSHDPRRIWVASVGGGVWHSIDGGNTFGPVDDFMANLVVSTLAIDPTNPDVVYAGTGEGFANLDALKGAGIFRTSDGITWSLIGATSGPNFSYVNRLAISSDGKTLIAATRSGIFVSSDAGRNSWKITLPGNIADVVFDPADNSRVVAGGLDTGDAYFSEDGGQTWQRASHNGAWMHVWEDGSTSPSRVELAFAMANHNIVYASVDNNSGEIWRSTDAGKSFAKMNAVTPDGVTANYLGGQGWYGNSIWAGDPTSSDFVIVGGIDLWKSTNGGGTVINISNWEEDKSAHADQHAIVSDPGYNGTTNKSVFFGNDGGIYMAKDVSTVGADDARVNGWTNLDHNYGATQFYGIAIAPDGKVVGGAQDNGTLLLSRGAKPDNWLEIFGGDGGFCAADSSDPSYVYGEYVQGNIHRLTQPAEEAEYISGQYWDEANRRWAWKGAPYEITDAQRGKANFIAPFVLDPNDSNRILVGALSLWETRDAKTPNTVATGPQWRPVKPPATEYVSAIAIAKSDSNQVWVGHNNGEIYFSRNSLTASPQWNKAGAGVLPQRYVTHISVDPKNASVVYVTFGGYSAGNIWKTNDAGVRWIELSGKLPAAPVFTITIHPNDSDYLYAGTEVGIFASEDGGKHWSPGNEGPTNSAVFDLEWQGAVLFAATHGRGIFKIDLSSVRSTASRN
jgi:photosystem II stability/assembly factor-like uncharacterized protein